MIVTTRFPRDSAARYAREADFADWGDRLEIYGLDLRHTPSVEAFCHHLLTTHERLDYVVNNACQTVRRPPDFYRSIRFDPELEALAFRKLAELDLDASRAAFGRLIGRLDFGSPGPHRHGVLLLLDVLQRVNRRLHRPMGEDADYHGERAALLELFAPLEDP